MNAITSELIEDIRAIESSGMFDGCIPQKRTASEYAMVTVVSCSQDNWWYKEIVGMEMLCRLVFYRGHSVPRLYEAQPVRLANKTMVIGRGFAPQDVLIQ